MAQSSAPSKPRLLLLLLLLVWTGFAVSKERSRLRLDSNGGYVDLVIAIDRSTPEDPAIVDKIKSALTELSQQLSVATKPMFNNISSLHLSHVYILVPKTWFNRTSPDIKPSTWQTYENSDIRVGRSPEEPHYTYHSRECAFPGDFSVFDTAHFNRTDSYWLGKQLLSEFGQLRWGLRPEHNGINGPHHYNNNGSIVPALCTKGIKGVFKHNITNERCKVDLITTRLEPNCRFYVDPYQTVRASVLATTEVRGIEYFCDHSVWGHETLRHDRSAPVPMQKACNKYSGAMSVMKFSQPRDFDRVPKPNEILPQVQFTVVRPLPYRRLVIIIDVSTSMGGNPLTKIKVGVEKFVVDLLEDGIECALVTFSDKVHLVKPLNFLRSAAIRNDYAKAVRGLVASGYTAIGDALAVGMKTLGVDPAKPTQSVPGYMLLLSDGAENRPQNYTLAAASAILKKTSIIVDTVAFGPSADKNLAKLSEDTNGLSFFSKFENSTNDFIEQLSETVRRRVDTLEMPLEVFSAPIETAFNIPVKIDQSIGKDTSFLLTSYRPSEINNIDLKVRSPSGQVYDKSSPQYTKDTTLGTVTIKISGTAEEGEWLASDGRLARNVKASWSNARVFNSGTALTVTSKPVGQEEPVVLEGSVSADSNIHLNRSTTITIIASMYRGLELIKGSKILAKVESEKSTDAVLTLSDDGVFPDLQPGDGIYSAQVPLKNIAKREEFNVRLISESPVSRVTSAGKFYVQSVDLGSLKDLPPNPVKDLMVSVNLASKTLNASWTATGNEQSQGTAATVIFKTSQNYTLLEENFDSADNVSVTVTPQEAGSAQSVVISADQLVGYNSTFYLALKTISNKGVESQVSNLEAVQLKLPDNIDSIDGTLTTTAQPSTTQRPEIPTTTAGARGSLQGCGVWKILLTGISLLTAASWLSCS